MREFLQAYLKQMGYEPCQITDEHFHSSLTYTKASLQNKDTDPYIVNIDGIAGGLKAWSTVLGNVMESFDWEKRQLDEVIIFKPTLYINKDGFLISIDVNNLSSLVSFKNENCFRRPVINNVDDRYDLGDKIFIVNDAGILFSLYEKPTSKTINRNSNIIRLFDDVSSLQRNTSIHFEVKGSLVGTYGAPFDIEAVHVLPAGDFWNQRRYDDWI